MEPATTSEGSTTIANQGAAIANFHVGQETETIYQGEETARIGNWQVNIQELKACYQYKAGLSYDSICYNHVHNILYNIELNVSKDAVTAETGDIVIEDVGPGQKKVHTNITVKNDFAPIKTSRMYVEVFGEKIMLDSGTIERGQHTYSVTAENNYYDASRFINRKTVNEELVLHFENPRLPQSRVSGKPDIDGDMRTYESFEPGGSKPSIQDLEEGDDRYSSVSSPCNIQFLRSHGFGTRNCHGYSGGEATPMSTQNHEFLLTSMRSKAFSFSTEVAYCGENATYKDGRCVVDKDLHLRSDVCPLLQRHQIVTETFPGGQTVSTEDLQPRPGFFCTKHPVLVTDSAGKQTKLTSEPYREMIQNGEVTVPEGQTYTLYWTVNVNEVNTTVVCKEGSFNQSTGKCVRTPGVTHQCSQGVFDPQSGSCVVTPETTYICEKGYYDKGLGKCVYEPPVDVQCDRGQYRSGRDKCVYEPEIDPKCPTGQFNNGTGTCEYRPPTEHICDRGYYDPSRDACLAEGTVKTVCPDNATLEDGVCKVEPRIVKITPLEQLRLGFARYVFENPVTVIVVVIGAAKLVLLAGVYRRRRGK